MEGGQVQGAVGGPLRPLSAGEILDGSFAIYRRNFPVVYCTQLATFIPSMALGFVSPLLGTFLYLLLIHLARLAAIWQFSEAVLGGKPNLSRGLKSGLRRLIPALAAEFVTGFLIALGWLAFLVPGVILWIVFFAVLPVVILEKNLSTCLQRSFGLAKGSWKKIFLVQLVAFLISILPGAAFQAPRVLNALLENRGLEDPSPLVFLLQILVESLVIPFSMGVTTLLYYDQRVRKEGLDVQLAASALEDLRPPAAPAAPPQPAI